METLPRRALCFCTKGACSTTPFSSPLHARFSYFPLEEPDKSPFTFLQKLLPYHQSPASLTCSSDSWLSRLEPQTKSRQPFEELSRATNLILCCGREKWAQSPLSIILMKNPQTSTALKPAALFLQLLIWPSWSFNFSPPGWCLLTLGVCSQPLGVVNTTEESQVDINGKKENMHRKRKKGENWNQTQHCSKGTKTFYTGENKKWESQGRTEAW